MIERVAQVLRVPPETLLAAAGYRVGPLPPPAERSSEQIVAELQVAIRRERAEYEALPSNVVMVPIVESFASAGEGAVAEVQTWPYVPTPEQAGHHFLAVRVKGDCLAPRVTDGELAIVDRDAEARAGDVVAVQVDGESLLRILEAGRLVSLNGHPPIPLTDQAHIEGVVVFVGRRP